MIRRLRTVFGPYGSVQFMHCETGGGTDGRRLMNEIANELEVPVSAGVNTQYGGGIKTFKFEGPTYTGVPGGVPLAIWCRALPGFAPMTPA